MIKRVSYDYRDFEMLRLKVMYYSYFNKIKKDSSGIAQTIPKLSFVFYNTIWHLTKNLILISKDIVAFIFYVF